MCFQQQQSKGKLTGRPPPVTPSTTCTIATQRSIGGLSDSPLMYKHWALAQPELKAYLHKLLQWRCRMAFPAPSHRRLGWVRF